MDIFVYCIKSITSISEFQTKCCPSWASQRSHSVNSGRILFLSMSHHKSIFMLIKKQVPRVQRNLSFDFCCVSLSPHWAEEHLAMSPSPCDKSSPSPSLLLLMNTQPAADLWPRGSMPETTKPRAIPVPAGLVHTAECFNPPVLFHSSLSISDHTKWLRGTSLISVE